MASRPSRPLLRLLHCVRVLATALAFVLAISIPALANNFVVTKVADTADGTCDADCSLREAILAANATSGDDTIGFDPNVFSTPQTIILSLGEILIGFRNFVITGPGSQLLTIDAQNQSRIFQSNGSANVTITGMRLIHGSNPLGGAMYATSATLTLRDFVFEDNSAIGAESYNNATGAFGGALFSGASFTYLVGCVFRNNIASGIDGFASGYGGGAHILGQGVIANTLFENNTAIAPDAPDTGNFGGRAGIGGGVYSTDIRFVNSTIIGNMARGGDGGLTPNGISGNGGAALGGGIYGSSNRIVNCTIKGNQAIAGDGGIVAGNGGAAEGGGVYDRNARIANSTIVDNAVIAGSGFVGGAGLGGGVRGGDPGWMIINALVAGNSVSGGVGTSANGNVGGGGIYSPVDFNAGTGFKNTIVAQNSAPVGPDVFGPFMLTGYNLIGNGDGATGLANGVDGNIVGTTASPIDPMLGPLANNGGFTRTRLLLPGSPAINAGSNGSAIDPIFDQPLRGDQRGLERIVGSAVDIGPNEIGAVAVPGTSVPDLQAASDTGVSDSDNVTKATSVTFDIGSITPGAFVELLRDGIVVDSIVTVSTNGIQRLSDISPPQNAVALYSARQSLAANQSAASAQLTVTYDQIGPVIAINQAANQADPTRLLPIRFTLTGNEYIGNIGTMSLAGSTANVSSSFTNISYVDDLTRTISVSGVTGNFHTVVGSFGVGTVTDRAGNFNSSAATSIDNVVVLDNTAPTVSVNQAVGQQDPTGMMPIVFRAQFSESVSGLTSSDISFSGSTAVVSSAIVSVMGTGPSYDISVTNIRGRGSVRVTIPAGAATDSVGNLSRLSTSTDNTVEFVGTNASQRFDFDGDGRSDIGIYRPSLGQWWLDRSTEGIIAHTFGISSDKIVPGDFTGDGKADVTIWRAGEWFVLRSEDFSFYSFPFGANEDIPVQGDYDGDGRTDAAVFRPSDATWYIQRSSGGTTIQTFGSSTDRPVPADYDGDGKTDIAIYRPSLGQWWLNRSTAGIVVHTFGNNNDKTVQGDYTGDGKADIAIWRQSTGEWFVLRSEDASYYSIPWGVTDDLPVPGDYDGDGKFDAGVFRPSNATWYINRSASGTLIQGFGVGTDQPISNSMVR